MTCQPMPQAPRVGRLPVVLFELDVVLTQINAHRAQRFEIQLLHVFRRRLQDDLQLHVLEQAVGIFSITSIGGAARGLHVSDFVRLAAPARAEKFPAPWCRRRLQHHRVAAIRSRAQPRRSAAQDEFLEGERIAVWKLA